MGIARSSIGFGNLRRLQIVGGWQIIGGFAILADRVLRRVKFLLLLLKVPIIQGDLIFCEEICAQGWPGGSYSC